MTAPSTPTTEDDLARIGDMPVRVTAIVGRAEMAIGDLLKAQPGSVLELDRKLGEPVDILVNDKLIARGEIVRIDERLGVTMTEIISTGS